MRRIASVSVCSVRLSFHSSCSTRTQHWVKCETVFYPSVSLFYLAPFTNLCQLVCVCLYGLCSAHTFFARPVPPHLDPIHAAPPRIAKNGVVADGGPGLSLSLSPSLSLSLCLCLCLSPCLSVSLSLSLSPSLSLPLSLSLSNSLSHSLSI